jgi:hypothetical protein
VLDRWIIQRFSERIELTLVCTLGANTPVRLRGRGRTLCSSTLDADERGLFAGLLLDELAARAGPLAEGWSVEVAPEDTASRRKGPS